MVIGITIAALLGVGIILSGFALLVHALFLEKEQRVPGVLRYVGKQDSVSGGMRTQMGKTNLALASCLVGLCFGCVFERNVVHLRVCVLCVCVCVCVRACLLPCLLTHSLCLRVRVGLFTHSLRLCVCV